MGQLSEGFQDPRGLGCCSSSWDREQKGRVRGLMEPGRNPRSLPGCRGGRSCGEAPVPCVAPQDGKHGFWRGDTDMSSEEPKPTLSHPEPSDGCSPPPQSLGAGKLTIALAELPSGPGQARLAHCEASGPSTEPGPEKPLNTGLMPACPTA